MPHTETGGVNRIEVTSIDETAFLRGREFLDGLIGKLNEFDGYPGIATPGHNYPRAEMIRVPVRPTSHQRMFFMVGGSAVTAVYREGLSQDGEEHGRREENNFGLGITEAREATIEYKPSSVGGNTRAIVKGLYGPPDQEKVSERGLIVVRRTYVIQELGRLEIAVVSKEDFPTTDK